MIGRRSSTSERIKGVNKDQSEYNRYRSHLNRYIKVTRTKQIKKIRKNYLKKALLRGIEPASAKATTTGDMLRTTRPQQQRGCVPLTHVYNFWFVRPSSLVMLFLISIWYDDSQKQLHMPLWKPTKDVRLIHIPILSVLLLRAELSFNYRSEEWLTGRHYRYFISPLFPTEL